MLALLKSQGKTFCVLDEDLTSRHVGQLVWFVSSLGPVAARTVVEVRPNTNTEIKLLNILSSLSTRLSSN